MLADIAHGKTGAADIFFLVAVILFVVAGAVAYQAKALWSAVLCLGLASTALALLLL